MSAASSPCAKVAHLHHLQHQSTSPMASCKSPTSLPGIEFSFLGLCLNVRAFFFGFLGFVKMSVVRVFDSS